MLSCLTLRMDSQGQRLQSVWNGASASTSGQVSIIPILTKRLFLPGASVAVKSPDTWMKIHQQSLFYLTCEPSAEKLQHGKSLEPSSNLGNCILLTEHDVDGIDNLDFIRPHHSFKALKLVCLLVLLFKVPVVTEWLPAAFSLPRASRCKNDCRLWICKKLLKPPLASMWANRWHHSGRTALSDAAALKC